MPNDGLTSVNRKVKEPEKITKGLLGGAFMIWI
jgi:hypothetical protein